MATASAGNGSGFAPAGGAKRNKDFPQDLLKNILSNREACLANKHD
jgi:hypothetical protein